MKEVCPLFEEVAIHLALLICHDGVADMGQNSRLPISCQPLGDENHDHRAGNQPYLIEILGNKDAVDNILHDPCAQRRRCGNDRHQSEGKSIALVIDMEIFRQEPVNEIPGIALI